MRTLGVVGAGRVGLTLARLAIASGLHARVSGSGEPVRVRRPAALYAPGAEAVRTEDAAAADLVALCMPLGEYTEIDPVPFVGRIVIDAMNYWPESDGERADLDDPTHPTSTLVQAHLPGARVVKAFNHVAFRDLQANARPSGSPHRIAIGVAGDDANALAEVSSLVDRLGFDPVYAGTLAESRVLEPTGPVFGAVLGADALRTRLGR